MISEPRVRKIAFTATEDRSPSAEFGDSVNDADCETEGIRVSVRLVNATLSRRGMLAGDQVRTCVSDAFVDIGAVRTILPQIVAQRLGLEAVGQRIAEYANGQQAAVAITGPVFFEIAGRGTIDEAILVGSEVIIGRTVLDKLDMIVDCAGQRLVPNPTQPDQPISKVR